MTWLWKGTHLGDLPGFPATGRPIEMSGATVYHLAATRLTHDEVRIFATPRRLVAVAGSVAVPELFKVERYPTVLQMTSTVTAHLPAYDAPMANAQAAISSSA